MSTSKQRSLSRRVRWTIVAAVVMVVAVPAGVLASHTFTDVPDDNVFHNDIAWLADNRVTIGCNPPDNTEFCPRDNVTRQQMAAFMRRLAETSSDVGFQVVDPEDEIAIPGEEPTELGSVDVTPFAGATVNLSGHVSVFTTEEDETGEYVVFIARDGCDGDPDETWLGLAISAVDDAPATVALTGYDVIAEPASYSLCVVAEFEGDAEGIAGPRGLTASWNPTGDRDTTPDDDDDDDDDEEDV